MIWAGKRCDASGMGFFESIPSRALPDDDEPEDQFEPHEPDWVSRPSTVLGAAVGVGGVVHRTHLKCRYRVCCRSVVSVPSGYTDRLVWCRTAWSRSSTLSRRSSRESLREPRRVPLLAPECPQPP
jgi:hypothetical protein